ncbi:DUF4302 domain-containing protein [Hyunsoonleella sp. SJ7]|uniref:DUF4302 domain-containing protein n=1 Tax=Hyunsoonleella aquatilis TaxID=2762758 RepID=A0A923H873_9FLAO|nr:DUF4302 domain-containing protein [Hyunsoonleella aquatilis]MBC3757848.1 DUF4302 domain-containing protein [Hyunsoonleella aquatilis]
MKFLIKYKYLSFILLFFFVLFSCSEDDTENVFGQAPADRVADRVNELQNLLVSQPNGYRAIYFPKNDQRGGFTIFMQFNADGTVRQTSDFDDDSTLQNSSYEVRLGTTTELVFTTRNHITKATDPTAVTQNINGFQTGIGFFGTSVFQYFSNDNGVITFRDVRNRDTASLILYPSNFTDFDAESVASVEASYANRQTFDDVDCSTASVYDSLVLEAPGEGGMVTYVLNYTPNTIFFDAETVDSEGVTTEKGIGAAFTFIDGKEAIIISPALEVGDSVFKDFVLDTSSGKPQYVATSNGATATISNSPLLSPSGEGINDDIALLESAFLYRISLGSNPLTSPCFQEEVIDQINANLDAGFGPGAFSLTQFQFIFNFNSDACDNFLFVQITRAADGAAFNAFYCYNRASVSNNRLFQEYTGPFGTGNGPFLEPFYAPLIDFFDNPASSSSGMLYTNEGPFRSNTNGFSNISGTFTKMDNQALRVYGLFFG